jgi:hypothetical protein
MKKPALILLIFALALSAMFAQRRGRGGYRGGYGGESWISEDTKTAREVPTHSTGTPVWTNAPGFEKDVWTFVRIKRDRAPYSSGGSWTTDAPDSDLNLSFRLQQMTSMKTSPDGRFLRLTEPELLDYPFIYMVEPGSLSLTEPEIAALKKYLLNGGFLWLDDFWGEAEWAGMAGVMKQVFPERDFVDVPLDHPIYHGVFEIKSKGQIPNVYLGMQSQYDPEHRTWEREDAREVHHRAIYDDKGRMMVFATHNTDNGDGWEREGEYQYYFEHFSEKIAFPLGINVIFYVMTH